MTYVTDLGDAFGYPRPADQEIPPDSAGNIGSASNPSINTCALVGRYCSHVLCRSIRLCIHPVWSNLVVILSIFQHFLVLSLSAISHHQILHTVRQLTSHGA